MSVLQIITLRHGLVLAGLLLSGSSSFADKVSGLVYEDGRCQGLSNAVVRFTPPKASDKPTVVTATDGSGLFTADLPTSEEYYLDVSIGTQQVYGRVVKITSDPLWIGLQSAERSQKAGSGNQPMFCKLTALRKLAIGQPLIESGRVVCGPSGDAPAERSIELDQNKNRTDQPLFYVPFSWDDLQKLPSDNRNDFQGAPVSVEGYLSEKIVVQNRGSGESANCHLLGNEEVDWHIYLTKSPNEQPKEAIIVETTPRVRPAHRWTLQMLTRYVASNTKVRISGWLMYDFQHVNVIGMLRATAWEVHPITKIEVQNNGQWVDLDNQP